MVEEAEYLAITQSIVRWEVYKREVDTELYAGGLGGGVRFDGSWAV